MGKLPIDDWLSLMENDEVADHYDVNNWYFKLEYDHFSLRNLNNE